METNRISQEPRLRSGAGWQKALRQKAKLLNKKG